MGRALGLVLAAVLAGGCAPDTERSATPPGAERREPAPPTPVPAARDTLPATVTGVVWIEGEPDTTTFTLQRAAEPFALFYLPEGLEAAAGRGAGGLTVRVTTRFAGTPRQDAGTTIFLAQAHADSAPTPPLPPAELERREPRLHAWTVSEHRVRGTGRDGRPVFGQWLVGRHAGRWFWMLDRYPAEMADGLGPRLAALRRSWRWSDTGTPLEPPGTPAGPR